MTYRDDLTALSARHDALSSEVAQKTKELESASRMLDEAKARARLPILDNIRVASPCSAGWANMTGDDRVRHCGECKKNVYNLSELTREEAETLILTKEGRLCVRYFQRNDGTILLKDCVVGISKRRKRKLIAAGAAALLAGTAGGIALRVTATEPITETAGTIAIDPRDGRFLEGEMRSDVPPRPPPTPHHVHEVKGEMAAEPIHDVRGQLEIKRGTNP